MFKPLAIGYGCALVCAIIGGQFLGGSLLGWAVFVWLAGAPITLAVGGLKLVRNVQFEARSVRIRSQKRKVQALR